LQQIDAKYERERRINEYANDTNQKSINILKDALTFIEKTNVSPEKTSNALDIINDYFEDS